MKISWKLWTTKSLQKYFCHYLSDDEFGASFYFVGMSSDLGYWNKEQKNSVSYIFQTVEILITIDKFSTVEPPLT